MAKSIQERGPDTALLVARLEKMEIGEEIKDSELSNIIDRDITKFRGALYSAIRILLSEKHMVFGRIRKTGIKRLDDSAIVTVGADGQRKIHRVARRSVKIIACADYDKLDASSKAQHNAALSALGAIAVVTKPSSIKQLTTAVSEAHAQLPVAKTLEMFAGK